jgi:hypothetical protein
MKASPHQTEKIRTRQRWFVDPLPENMGSFFTQAVHR